MNAPNRSTSEAYFSIRARQMLERAFQPITNSTLGSYIFSPPPKPSAEAITTSAVLRIEQKLVHDGLSGARAFTGPHAVGTPQTERSEVCVVITPLYRVCKRVCGIVSVSGETVVRGGVMPFTDALNGAMQRGKFVYDSEGRHMVCVLDGMCDEWIGVVSARWVGDGIRERSFFVVPRGCYTFGDMPKEALVVVTNVEYRVSKVVGEGEVMGCASGVGDGDGGLRSAVEGLVKGMSGLYYGPDIKRDDIDIRTQELCSRVSGKIVARLWVPQEEVKRRIRMAVVRDIVFGGIPEGLGLRELDGGVVDKKEERRRRNRLSAARSNARRKERELGMMKELEQLKGRLMILERVRESLVEENRALRLLSEMIDNR